VHDLTKLVNVANLAAPLSAEAAANPRFRDYWEVVKDWNESSRYELWSQQDAQEFLRRSMTRTTE
jgi:16S rRNA G527 N7-methylase RsmG